MSESFGQWLKAKRKAAGLNQPELAERSGVTFHSTRHSFTSRLVRVTDLDTAQSFTGHSSAIMVGYYAHTNPEERKKAMRKMYSTDEKWQNVYDAIRSGSMSFEAFLEALK